jgi:hypothetical protein
MTYSPSTSTPQELPTTGRFHLRARVASLFLIAALTAASLVGQQITGGLRGTVVDPSGASVVNASVELRNQATGIAYKQTTDAEGQFVINLLSPGSYLLQVSAQGFQTMSMSAVMVEVNKITSVLAPLKLGATSESIDVKARASVIDTATAALGVSVQSDFLANLPTTTSTRNPLAYAEMASPGVRLTDRGSQVVGNSGSAMNSNGNRNGWNIFYLDGSDNTGPYRGTVLQMPNPEAIAEVQVTTGNSGADVGKMPGALVNVITKSGTNQFHGSGFYFFGLTDLNANSWTRNQSGTARPSADLKQVGGALGGPIRRDKTFFFASTQAYRDQVHNLQNTALFPTQAMLGGDLSAFSGQLYDPDTHQPIPGNRIPTRLMDPVAAKLAALMPTSPAYLTRYNYPYDDQTQTQEVLGKLDHNIGNAHRLQGSYFHMWGELLYPMTNSTTNHTPAWGPQTNGLAQDTLSIQHVWTVRPTLLLESRFSLSNHKLNRQSNQLGRNLADFGAIWPNSTQDGRKYLPYLNVSNAFSTAQGTLGLFEQRNKDFRSTMTWVKGRHNLKFGGEYQYRSLPQNNDQDSASFAFTGQFSSTTPAGAATGTGTYGYAVADFLMGRIGTFSVTGRSPVYPYSWMYFFYAQDEWRISRKLTLTPGIRYETYSQIRDSQDNIADYVPGLKSSVYPAAPAGLIFTGDSGVPEHFHPMHRVWAPRLGLAYDPKGDGKMAIRAGFGMYYSPIAMQWGISSLPWSNSSASGAVALLPDPWGSSKSPVYAKPPTPFIPNPSTYVYPPAFAASGYDPGLKRPYAMQWNTSVERSLTQGIKVQAAYVANRGGNQLQWVSGNLPVWTSAASLNNIQNRRPYSAFGDNLIMTARARSWYDALQLSGDIRTRGLTSRFTYVYGQARSIQDEEWTVPNLSVNQYNIDGEKGENSPRHSFRYFAVYPLPFLRNSRAAVRIPFGGWRLSGSLYLTSGLPLNVILGQDWNYDGVPNDRPDLVSPVQYTSGSNDAKAAAYFSKTSFATPAVRNTYGSLKRNSLWAPGQYWQPNLALMKEFHFTETKYAQFRMESYDFLNHNNLDAPNGTFNNTNFGRILTRTGNRTFQLGIRAVF